MSAIDETELCLDKIEHGLTSHFKALANQRTLEKPVFAIEHGLDHDARDELSKNLSIFSARYRPHSVHKLCWIVFASEIGYQFDGMDYWEPFEDTIGRAFAQSERQTLKRYFRWFQREFHGVVPEGAWAEHRSIISWPVTHALIPRSLQEIFVQHLFRNRGFLTGILYQTDSTENGRDIGEELKRTRYQVADRYQYFFEQTNVVRKLARAVILHEPETHPRDETFHFQTLTRLIEDLERYEHTKQWIERVRDKTKESFRKYPDVIQTEPPDNPDSNPDDVDDNDHPIQQSERLECRPQLTHKPNNHFGLSLRFYGFSSMARTVASIRDFLKKSRATVAGSGGKRQPPGWLTFGNPNQPIIQFDASNYSLLEFDITPPVELSDRLQELSYMEDGVLIFKRSVDGTTRCLKSHAINESSASDYLVLLDYMINDAPFLEEQQLDCEGLYLYSFNELGLDSENARNTLKDLGIGIIQKISITPIDNLPFNWDGDGYGEWIIGEDVIFKIRTSHPFDRLVVTLDQTTSQEFKVEHETTGYVRISGLTQGTHNLNIEVKEFIDWERSIASIDVEILISETQTAPPQPFVSQLTPSDDLDLFWGDESELMLYGPEGAPYAVHLTFDAGRSNRDTHKIHESRFPFKRESWLTDFTKFRRDHFGRYLDSRSADLEVNSNNLGNYTHHLNRELKPLRWQTKRQNNKIKIKLINDHSVIEDEEDIHPDDSHNPDEHTPLVSLFPFDKPWELTLLDQDFLTYTDVGENGGLLVAEFETLTDIIIVEKPTLTTLETSEVLPNNQDLLVNDILNLIQQIGKWRSSRSCIQNNLRKNKAISLLKSYLVYSILSSNWSRLEQKFEGASLSDLPLTPWNRFFRDIRGGSIEEFLLSLVPIAHTDESKNMLYEFLIKNRVMSIAASRFNQWIRVLNEPEHPEIQHMNEKHLATLLEEVRRHNSAAKLIRMLHILKSRSRG